MSRGRDTLTIWDRRFMALAAHVSGWSKDPSTKVGAVLVGRDRRCIAVGYNGFPPGIEDSPQRLNDRETKYRLTQHAERNVLDNARFPVWGGTLYVTFYPCAECAKSIVTRGVARVVCPPAPERAPWAEESDWAASILEEAGVRLVRVVFPDIVEDLSDERG